MRKLFALALIGGLFTFTLGCGGTSSPSKPATKPPANTGTMTPKDGKDEMPPKGDTPPKDKDKEKEKDKTTK
jgi:hypothetical protein